jgi:PIN domain nuclease of toxin-antitoxin system
MRLLLDTHALLCNSLISRDDAFDAYGISRLW